MDASNEDLKGRPFNLNENIEYAIKSVVSKTLLKKNT